MIPESEKKEEQKEDSRENPKKEEPPQTESEDPKENLSGSTKKAEKDQKNIEEKEEEKEKEEEEAEEFDETSSTSAENETLSHAQRESNEELLTQKEDIQNTPTQALPPAALRTRRSIEEHPIAQEPAKELYKRDKEEIAHAEQPTLPDSPRDAYFNPSMVFNPKNIEQEFIWDEEASSSKNAASRRRNRIIIFLVLGVLLIIGIYFLASYIAGVRANAQNLSQEAVSQNIQK